MTNSKCFRIVSSKMILNTLFDYLTNKAVRIVKKMTRTVTQDKYPWYFLENLKKDFKENIMV